MIREAIVKGQFYPGQKAELLKVIQSFAHHQTEKVSARGIIVPHAGYPFSGKVAVETISKIKEPKNIIMLGPNHTGLGKSFSLATFKKWQTPLGLIKVNQNLSEKILRSGSLIIADNLAHKNEHSLEVILPILQYFFKNFSLVPICCSLAEESVYKQVAQQITMAIEADWENTLILVSTDLTHYQPDTIAREKDEKLIETIVELDPGRMIQIVKKDNINTCGLSPLAIALFCLKGKVDKCKLVLYQNSGDTTGDYNSVVGYAGLILGGNND